MDGRTALKMFRMKAALSRDEQEGTAALLDHVTAKMNSCSDAATAASLPLRTEALHERMPMGRRFD